MFRDENPEGSSCFHLERRGSSSWFHIQAY